MALEDLVGDLGSGDASTWDEGEGGRGTYEACEDSQRDVRGRRGRILEGHGNGTDASNWGKELSGPGWALYVAPCLHARDLRVREFYGHPGVRESSVWERRVRVTADEKAKAAVGPG